MNLLMLQDNINKCDNNMENLLEDVILTLCLFLTDKEKIYFLSASRKFDEFKIKTEFCNRIKNDCIYDLPYFDRFTNVIICRDYKKLPLIITRLTFDEGIYYNRYQQHIPNSVTHLIVGVDIPPLYDAYKGIKECDLPWDRRFYYNPETKCKTRCVPNEFDSEDEYHKSYPNMIPNTVKYVDFDYDFDKSLQCCIPNSVTHLLFRDYFNRPIENCIPDSVTHLIFGYYFNRSIKNCIPNSVTHLEFGCRFNKPIENCIPDSVVYLKFGNYFNQSIKNCIPKSVIYLHISINLDFTIDTLPNTLKYLHIEGKQVIDLDDYRQL
jgi:hypothetical protein